MNSIDKLQLFIILVILLMFGHVLANGLMPAIKNNNQCQCQGYDHAYSNYLNDDYYVCFKDMVSQNGVFNRVSSPMFAKSVDFCTQKNGELK